MIGAITFAAPVDWAHVWARFFLHIAWGIPIYIAVWIAYDRLKDKWPKQWALAVPALMVAWVAFIREPFDVAQGQPWVKALTDYISWALACTAGAFLVFWARKWARRHGLIR